jgi:hypothetical protein
VTAPRIPPTLARRLDRLARRAHAFHRFAHHPLCAPYRDEVVRLGRLYLCKGCSLLGVGILVGLLAGAGLAPSPACGLAALALALCAGMASLRWRVPKIVGRLAPGVGLGLALCAGAAAALGALLIVAVSGWLYRRRGVARGRCATCAEDSQRPCPGFARIVRRERAYGRVAARWLREDGRFVA